MANNGEDDGDLRQRQRPRDDSPDSSLQSFEPRRHGKKRRRKEKSDDRTKKSRKRRHHRRGESDDDRSSSSSISYHRRKRKRKDSKKRKRKDSKKRRKTSHDRVTNLEEVRQDGMVHADDGDDDKEVESRNPRTVPHVGSVTKDQTIRSDTTSNAQRKKDSSRQSAMVPMTREQYEAEQAQVREVYDAETGRYRLVRGTGEIIERIVSRSDHQAINTQATRGDGSSFARHVFSASASTRR